MAKHNTPIGSTDLFTAVRIADDATKDLYTYSALATGGQYENKYTLVVYCGTSYDKAKAALIAHGGDFMELCTWLDGKIVKNEEVNL